MRKYRAVTKRGYVRLDVGKDHHLANGWGYASEHRVVAEKTIGRRLLKGEIVHHINGNKSDNRPENLEVCSNAAEHGARHRTKNYGLRQPGSANPTIECGCGCGRQLAKYDCVGRPRAYLVGHCTPPGPAQNAVINAIGSDVKARIEVAIQSGLPVRYVGVILNRMKKLGKAKQIRQGFWALTQGEKKG